MDAEIDVAFREAYERQYSSDKLCTTCRENNAIGGMVEQFVHFGNRPTAYGVYPVCHQKECLKSKADLKPGHGREFDSGGVRIYIGSPDNPEEIWRKDRFALFPSIDRLDEVEHLVEQLGLIK